MTMVASGGSGLTGSKLGEHAHEALAASPETDGPDSSLVPTDGALLGRIGSRYSLERQLAAA